MTGLKDAAKSALLVWLFTTVGLFVPGMLGWIQEVTQWANQKGAPAFPDPSNLAYLFVAALTAAFPAAVAGIVRYIENASGTRLLPRTASAPVPPARRNDVGQSVLYWALVVLAILAIVWLVLFAFGSPR